jgi:hypothetical protein
MCTGSRAESQVWVNAINAMMASVPEDLVKSALLRELLSDGAARVNLRKKFNRRERKAREAFTAARLKSAKRAGSMSEGAAIAILQRAMRGHLARNMVRGWVKVKDPEDPSGCYYYNINTGKSEWKAPWHSKLTAAVAAAPVPAAPVPAAPVPAAPAPALAAPAPVSAPPAPVSAPPAPVSAPPATAPPEPVSAPPVSAPPTVPVS